jgi:hypothetical protein
MIPINITPFDADSYLHFVWYKCSECGHSGNFPAKLNLETSTFMCPHCQSALVRDPTSELGIRFLSNWFMANKG